MSLPYILLLPLTLPQHFCFLLHDIKYLQQEYNTPEWGVYHLLTLGVAKVIVRPQKNSAEQAGQP